jgi:zinc protease
MKSRLLRAVLPAVLGAACAVSLPAAAVPTAVAPVVPQAPGYAFVKVVDGIYEYRLEANGLTVLVAPDSSVPVVSFQVTYLVGSRNEVTGTTGATHILEHMMFKGSDSFNEAKGNSLKRYLERVGAQFNATTSQDRTNYFATLGRDDLDGYVAAEADRMRHLLLRDSDRQAEMTVVRNEYERGRNSPESVLFQEVQSAAFEALPYHHPIIGWLSDIEHVPITKLQAFYDTFYWPDNSVITIAGDVEIARALALVRRYYGGYQHSPAPIPQNYTEEPVQHGPRRLVVNMPGELGSVLIAHKLPNGLSPDQPAIEVMDAILASGKSSRLYHALVDAGLALGADADTALHRDASLHTLYASLAPGATHAQVEAALLAELERIRNGGVTEAELARVKQQYVAENAYRRDGSGAIVSELNSWIAIGDWTRYVTFPQQIAAVTAADVQRVARQYFDPSQGTTGWYMPETAAEEHAK